VNKTAEIVAAIISLVKARSKPENMLVDLGKRFPDCGRDQFERAFHIARDQMQEAQRAYVEDYERESRFLEWALEIMEEFPGIKFGEAVAIKAGAGDPLALEYIRHEQTPARRTYAALADAAYNAHPQFSVIPHGYMWHGKKGAAPSESDLIDWFQMAHPAEARRIEDSIEAAAP
jgi:hypothetical protein